MTTKHHHHAGDHAKGAARRHRPRRGFRLSDGFIGPLDLAEIGLLSAEEAQDLHDLETSAVESKP